MKLSDFKGLFNRSTLTFISAENPFGDYWRIRLKPAAETVWIAGEHGIFTLPGKRIKGKAWRAFSVASIPQEGEIIIGTRTGEEVSNFKKALINMKPGDKVNVLGPFGWLKIQDKKSPVVMAAGGVGITPIRALFKLLENDSARPINLVYQSKDYYLFGDELLAIASANPAITLQMTKTKEDTESSLTDLFRQFGNKAYYYISGPRPFIKTIKSYMKGNGIKGGRILIDPFYGY